MAVTRPANFKMHGARPEKVRDVTDDVTDDVAEAEIALDDAIACCTAPEAGPEHVASRRYCGDGGSRS